MLKSLVRYLSVAIERYLLLWLLLFCWIAYAWPSWFGAEAYDPFIATPGWLVRAVFALVMFCIGGLIPREEVLRVAKKGWTVLGGTLIQYVSMPLLAYAMVRFFNIEGPWAIGIMMAGCVPGAMASNVLTLMARGNTSYSVGLTTSATLLSPLIVPWALKISLQQEVPNFPVEQTFVQLCYMVVGPVILGHCLSHPFEQVRRFMKVAGPIVANLAILWVIVVIVGQKRAMLTDISPVIFAVLVIMNACGYACGFFGGKAMRLDRPMRRALTLEVGMQNAGLGAVLASDLFPDTPAAVPPVVYMFGCMMTGTVLARVWAELSAREAKDDPK